MPDLASLNWVDLFNVLWPGPHAIRTKGQADAFEASVTDRLGDLPRGEVARALQTISERQRSGDKTCWKGTPTPAAVVSQIIKMKYDSNRPPDEVARQRSTRQLEYRGKCQDAKDHTRRWELICEVGEYPYGTVKDCEDLHRWVSQSWPDFPVDVQECRRRYGGFEVAQLGPDKGGAYEADF